MVFDPFKEQLHMPSVFIDQRNLFCLEAEVICVIDDTPMRLRNMADDPSDDFRKLLFVLLLCKADTLIVEYVVCSIKYTFSVNNFIGRISRFYDDKECSAHVDFIEPTRFKVTFGKYITGQWLIGEPVHRDNVMGLAQVII